MSNKQKKKSVVKRRKRKFGIVRFLLILFVVGIGGYFYYLQINKVHYLDSTDYQLIKLVNAYPNFIAEKQGNYLVWKDGARMQISDNLKNKSNDALLDSPSIADQFKWVYQISDTTISIPKDQDPGRIRYLPIFKKMYGSTEIEVRKNLIPVIWLPKTIGDTVLITRINGVDKALANVSQELDKIPGMGKYLKKIGGTFNWRQINGSDRSSPHSFGIAIDINIDSSNYWQWDCKCKDETATLEYRNKIPMQIVKIFEKNKFIWGGRWYHYDTMHFEYRPEFFDD
jgi:hypothetical protein